MRAGTQQPHGDKMTIILEREIKTTQSTMGRLYVCDTFFYTIEPAWNDNKKNDSCIPTGEYICVPIVSKKFGATYCITGVEGRDHILIHAGNTTNDTSGCVIIGMERGINCVGRSKEAMVKFLNLINKRQSFKIIIK